MALFISDLPPGAVSDTTQLEVQNGADGQKITVADLVAYLQGVLDLGAIQSIQRGYASGTVATTGTGDTNYFIDVTIAPVDTTKCVVILDGSGSSGGVSAGATGMYGPAVAPSSTTYSQILGHALINSTTLRIGLPLAVGTPPTTLRAKWQVVEYK